MPRRPGIPKTGGRQKGTPNKKTQDLEVTLSRLGVDIPSQIIEILPQLLPEKKIDVLMGLMAFLYPKRKAVEQQMAVEPAGFIVENLSDEELHKKMAAMYQNAARTAQEPEITEAYQKLANYYGGLGSIKGHAYHEARLSKPQLYSES